MKMDHAGPLGEARQGTQRGTNSTETRIPSLRPIGLTKRRDAERYVENEIDESVRL
jgi:hypothetical protein